MTAPAAPPARLRDVVDRRVAVVLVLATALYGVFVWRPSFTFRGQRWFTLFDDAMISMTYGRNLAEGHGLVWTPGEPAVEGYTNPLWTVVMAVLHKLGLGEQVVPLAVSLVGLVLLLTVLVAAAAIAARLAPGSRVAPVAAAVLTALFYPLVYWTLRGMEVGLVTLVVLLLVWLGLRLADGWSPRLVVALCAVAAVGLLTRDDVVVPVVAVGLWLAWSSRGRERAVAVGALASTVVAVTVVHLAFRLGVYGEPLPNTYYLKVSQQPLGPRLQRGFDTFVAVLLSDLALPVLVTVAGLRRRLWQDRAVALPVLVIASLVAYSISVGGDAWEWAGITNRYLTPAAVLLLVLTSVAVEPLTDALRRTRRLRGRVPSGAVIPVVLLVLVAVAATGGDWRGWVRDAGFYTAKNQGALALGEALAEVTAPDATIAVVWAGAPIYHARRAGVDLLGKMDPVIARGPHHPGAPMYPGHDKYDFDHSIGTLRPDVVAQYAWFTDETVDDLLAWGYRPMQLDPARFGDVLALDVPRSILWVRSDSSRVDRSQLVDVPVDEARRIVTATP